MLIKKQRKHFIKNKGSYNTYDTNIGGTMQNNNKTPQLKTDKIIPILEERKKELQNICIFLKNEIEKSPKGYLRISASRGITQYYYKPTQKGSTEKYLPKTEKNLAHLLAQNKYNQDLLFELNKELDEINRFYNNYHPEKVQEIYNKAHSERKALITPIILSDVEYIKHWETLEYEHMGFKENTPEYYSAKGERVRSKSEIIIADTLHRMKIPYRYEYPVIISGMGTVHVDFYCLNVRTREEFVWEHFGMMDNDVYSNGAVGKLEKYMLNNYWPGVNFIATFESVEHPLSTKIIEAAIKRHLV